MEDPRGSSRGSTLAGLGFALTMASLIAPIVLLGVLVTIDSNNGADRPPVWAARAGAVFVFIVMPSAALALSLTGVRRMRRDGEPGTGVGIAGVLISALYLLVVFGVMAGELL